MGKFHMSKNKTNQKKTFDDGFANFVTNIGIRANNAQSAATYYQSGLTKNRLALENRYRGSWIAGAAVDYVAEDMIKAGIDITSKIDPELIKEIKAAMEDLGVWSALCDNIKWGRLYGGSIAVIEIEGQDKATELRMDRIAPDSFKGLSVYSRWEVVVDVNNLVRYGKDRGFPKFYRIVSDINTGEVYDEAIHHSRVIRSEGIKLPYWQAITEDLWGMSVLERIDDRMIAFDNATMSASALVDKSLLRTVQIPQLRDKFAQGGLAEQNLLKQFELINFLQRIQGITLLDKEDTFQTHSYTFTGISDIITALAQQLSGGLDIPMARLASDWPSGLNSSSEGVLRMYYDSILAKQTSSGLKAGVTKILDLICISHLGIKLPKEFSFSFVPLYQTSQKEKADISGVITSQIALAYEKGIISQKTALQELKESSEESGVYTNITDEEIEDSDFSPPPTQKLEGDVEIDQKIVGEGTDSDVLKSWLTNGL